MKVMQLQLDEATYADVEQRALVEMKSLTAVVRDALARHLKSQADSAGTNGGLNPTERKRSTSWRPTSAGRTLR